MRAKLVTNAGGLSGPPDGVHYKMRTGISDGEWIVVTNLHRPTASKIDHSWKPIDGLKQVILGDLSILADNAPVNVVTEPGGTKVASANPQPCLTNTPSGPIHE